MHMQLKIYLLHAASTLGSRFFKLPILLHQILYLFS
ncbi:hypothetical protein GLYMA_11G176316v4 [Glycine max]|nr:hypothetical protein GYH30_057236 [Glycine max]KRH31049.2 hypothetical protein GLYMA_11G176316v4 [Glycine max]